MIPIVHYYYHYPLIVIGNILLNFLLE